MIQSPGGMSCVCGGRRIETNLWRALITGAKQTYRTYGGTPPPPPPDFIPDFKYIECLEHRLPLHRDSRLSGFYDISQLGGRGSKGNTLTRLKAVKLQSKRGVNTVLSMRCAEFNTFNALHVHCNKISTMLCQVNTFQCIFILHLMYPVLLFHSPLDVSCNSVSFSAWCIL